MTKKAILLSSCGVIFSYFLVSICLSLQTTRNDISIVIADSRVNSTTLTVAVIGDLHLSEDPGSLSKFRSLISQVKTSNPDLVVFVGDYIKNPRDIVDIATHRKNIINAIKLVGPIPNAIVLGNYESWSNPKEWYESFSHAGLNVMENETSLIKTSKGLVCIRGFGDDYTGQYRYIDFPRTCNDLPTLSITHDPAAAFYKEVKGLVIAGHTHCGQVSIPFIGPLWVPSSAPSEGHCGLYIDSERTLFVTSGVGTSILPLRYGAQSQWDLINIQYSY
jgi:predicted MPP superfamily phosphohydrolase